MEGSRAGAVWTQTFRAAFIRGGAWRPAASGLQILQSRTFLYCQPTKSVSLEDTLKKLVTFCEAGSHPQSNLDQGQKAMTPEGKLPGAHQDRRGQQ